jgi:hypothetical protein
MLNLLHIIIHNVKAIYDVQDKDELGKTFFYVLANEG